MCLSAKKLADAMKSHEALLLPALYRDFVHDIEQHYEDLTGSEEVPYETIPGTRWLLAQLHSLFGNLLRVECKHRRFGSLLCHRDCDLVNALSIALGKVHKHRQLDSYSTIQTIPELNISTQVNIVANDRLHTQIRGQTVKTTRCHHYHDASSRGEPVVLHANVSTA